MRLLRLCALLAIGAVGLGLVGCGSSSTPSPKDEYIAKLDAVCARFAKDIGPDRRAFRKALAERQGVVRIGRALHRTARDLAREYNQLNNFKPPPADEVKLDRMLHAVEAEALITDEYATALEVPGPSSTAVFVKEIQTDANEAQQIAQGYGFKAWSARGR